MAGKEAIVFAVDCNRELFLKLSFFLRIFSTPCQAFDGIIDLLLAEFLERMR